MTLAPVSQHGRAPGEGQMDQCRWRELSHCWEALYKRIFHWLQGRERCKGEGWKSTESEWMKWFCQDPLMRRSPQSHLTVPELKPLIRNLQTEVTELGCRCVYEHGRPRGTEALTAAAFSTVCIIVAGIHICGESSFPQGAWQAEPLQLPKVSHEWFQNSLQ